MLKIKEMGYPVTNNTFLQVGGMAVLIVGILFFITYLLGTALGALFPSKKV